MSYHEKLPALKELVDQFIVENNIQTKVDLARIIYEALKCCPRVQGAVKKTIMRGVIGSHVNLKEVTKVKEYGHDKGGTYQALEITAKKLFD